MPPWNKELSNLRNILANLYWNQNAQYTIVKTAGMNPIYIDFTTSAITTWQSIIDKANNTGKLDALIAAAYEENPGVQALAPDTVGQLHLAIQGPPITGSWQVTDASTVEKLTQGVSSLRPIYFLERGLRVARPVCRVVLADKSKGSGFLIADNLLITNNHVIDSPAVAQGATIEFNYQQTVQGTSIDPTVYTLAPDKGFATSLQEDQGGDDWTAVRVAADANAEWGALPLTPATVKMGDEVIIIQHPNGQQKQIALSHNTVAAVTDKRVQYYTDTLEGSSGSPVFNADWQVVALHHQGGWLRDPNSKVSVFRNQGVAVNVLIAGLAEAKQKGQI